MPNVLVLYPGPVSFRQHEVARHKAALKDAGIRLVLADDYVVESDGAVFDDVLELPAPEHVGDAWRMLQRYASKHTIHAVLAQSESSILTGALLTQVLGLSGLHPRAAYLCVHKYLSRCELERRGVPVPMFRLADHPAHVRAFARAFGYPVVLKGVASALGRLVTLVKNDAEVDAAVARVAQGLKTSLDIARLRDFAASAGMDLECDPSVQFLVETFAKGEPVETDGLVVGKKPRSFGVTGQVMSAPPLFFLEGYLLPADKKAPEIEAIERVSNAALEALEVRNTGYSIEMRVNKKDITVIEVNGRLGWDEGFGDLFHALTGQQPSFLALELALGKKPVIEPVGGVCAALAYLSHYQDGLVKRLPTPAEIARVETTGLTIGLAVQPNARMYSPPHPDVTPHLAYALAKHDTSSRKAFVLAHAAVKQLRFEIEPVQPER